MSIDKPKISVVIPVFNAAEYLFESLDSILNQTYRNFECIIVNDGSSDLTEKIITYYEQRDNRIIKIMQPNKGIIYSLNKAIDFAKGEYIARMDADDISMPARLEKQLKIMESDCDIGVCGSWVEVFPSKKIIKYYQTDAQIKDSLARGYGTGFAHPAVMIRKSILRNEKYIYRNEAKHAEDFDLWVRLAHITKFYNIPEVLLKYRQSINQISKKYSHEQMEITTKIRETLACKGIEKKNIVLSIVGRVVGRIL